MQEIITKTDLCKLLDITPRVAQRELEKALLIENSGVFKFGKSYRIYSSNAGMIIDASNSEKVIFGAEYQNT